jgi:hypothetical protein
MQMDVLPLWSEEQLKFYNNRNFPSNFDLTMRGSFKILSEIIEKNTRLSRVYFPKTDSRKMGTKL